MLREQSAQTTISKRIQTSCQDPEPGDEDDDKEKKERKEKKKQVLFAWMGILQVANIRRSDRIDAFWNHSQCTF